MRPVLVSSCLLGLPVRYDGRGAPCTHPVLARWLAEGRIIPVCPELEGGLATPRNPAEIADPGGGAAVLRDQARVLDAAGADLTAAFREGARRALAQARAAGAALAVLKGGSPSCGSGAIHDGSFSGRMLPLPGVAAACLMEAGIPVFSEDQLEAADRCLAAIEGDQA
jgi:uncharacterized protein YbbK (DUF523 family)